MIEHVGAIVADTQASICTLETSHPPSYCIPPAGVPPGVLREAEGSSFCEWKGVATYWDVVIGDLILPRVGWSYPDPTQAFESLRDHIAFCATPFDRCSVDGATVVPQPSEFSAEESHPLSQDRSRACPETVVGEENIMFIAMNRFQIIPGEEEAFEQVWTSRDSHLDGVPGFVEFHLLRGATEQDHTLFSSHTIWRSRDDFEAWRRSDAFRKAHAGAGGNKPLYLGHPRFEGFEVVQTVRPQNIELA